MSRTKVLAASLSAVSLLFGGAAVAVAGAASAGTPAPAENGTVQSPALDLGEDTAYPPFGDLGDDTAYPQQPDSYGAQPHRPQPRSAR
ncbi:hypothetical protein ACIBEK_11545 [Nocardia fusca]|uniref:hypothetical protein n=1 Tax=Nocardia fusca TaxID=941183 RepID=UPI00379A9A2C